MAPQIVDEICPPFDTSRTKLNQKQRITGPIGNHADAKTKVTITAHPVMPKMLKGGVCLKSCLKKPNNRLGQKSPQIRFSSQTEVRYYLSCPLVTESRLKRMVSNVKGKLLARKG